jgi:hypothetical protein
VHFCIIATQLRGLMQKRTYTVHNCTRTAARRRVMQKCTGKPDPPPLLPQLMFAEPADAPWNQSI